MGDQSEPSTPRRLETYFEAARSEIAAPSVGLMARVLSDAHAVQAGLLVLPDQTTTRRARLHQAFRALVGWPAVTGLATATVAGVWIGVKHPDAVTPYTAFLQQDAALYQVDLPVGAGFDVDEGSL